MAAAAPHLPERYHGLDTLRGFALLLGVVLHGALSFLPGPGFWLTTDASRSTALSVAFFVIHMLRMTTFFLLAGFMARLLWQRRGTAGLLWDRLRRITLPLVAAWPVMLASLIAAAAWGAWRATGEAPPPSQGPRLGVRSFPLTHLWFLYVLTLFYPALLLVRAGLTSLDRRLPVRRVVDALVRGLVGPWAPILLALPLAGTLYAHPYWLGWFGIPTPDMSLIPNRPAVVSYGMAFALGWLLHRQPALLERLKTLGPWFLLLAVGATVACLADKGMAPYLMPLPQGGGKLFYASVYGLGVWAWALALFGLSLRWFNAPRPSHRYLADASYWIYLTHLPVVVFLQVWMARWPLGWELKFPLLLALAMGFLLLTYHFLVRSTFLGAALNGRRHPRSA